MINPSNGNKVRSKTYSTSRAMPDLAISMMDRGFGLVALVFAKLEVKEFTVATIVNGNVECDHMELALALDKAATDYLKLHMESAGGKNGGADGKCTGKVQE